MRSTLFLSLVLLIGLAAPDAWAGRIFGDIKLEGKPLPAGVAVKIERIVAPAASADVGQREPAVIDSTVTDEFGSYKLTVAGEGKCLLTLVYEKQAPSLEVFSYKEATRYDLVLERKDGILSLRRK